MCTWCEAIAVVDVSESAILNPPSTGEAQSKINKFTKYTKKSTLIVCCVKIRNCIPSTKKFIRRMEPNTCRDVENVKFVERRNKLTVAPE